VHFYSPPKQPIAVLFIIAFTVFACDEQPTDSTTECASCEYDVDVYGGLMGAYYGDRLVSVNEELNAIIKINSNGDMTLVNDLNRVSVNLSQSVANKY